MASEDDADDFIEVLCYRLEKTGSKQTKGLNMVAKVG
jgi:hypothetical protein